MAKEKRPDIEAALDKPTKMIAWREVSQLPDQLADGETVEQLETGKIGKKDGLLAVTDRRLLFVYRATFSTSTEDVPYAVIDSVEWRSKLTGGALTLHVRGREIEIKMIGGQKVADVVRSRMGQQSAPTAASTASAVEPDAFAQIERLGELRDKGLLSAEEFEAKKAELLGRL